MKALNFEGSGGEYFKIWIVNVMLVIVTLGLYYPWAKVRNHRYFYGNTTLEGRNFEYHATGKQLFLGYLIAMALFIIYIVIQQVSPIGSLVVVLIFFVAIPWVIWRSLKFSMRMTSFSNVRFGFDGTLGQSYINYFVYPFILFLVVYGLPITFAIMVPAAGLDGSLPGYTSYLAPLVIIVAIVLAVYLFALIKKKNATYRINGARYGQGVFSTNLETKKFIGIAVKTILLSLLVFGVIFLLIGVVVSGTMGMENIMQMQQNMQDPQLAQQHAKALAPIIMSVYGGLILGSILVVAYSFTRQREYIFANSNLDEKITFASTLKAKSYAWVMLSNFILVLITLGLAFPWAKVRVARLMTENTLVDTEAGFYDYVTQKQNEESSLGEQIGDAFDVDVGLGF